MVKSEDDIGVGVGTSEQSWEGDLDWDPIRKEKGELEWWRRNGRG